MTVVDQPPQPVLDKGIEAAESVVYSPASGDGQVEHGRVSPTLRCNTRLTRDNPFKFAPSTDLELATILTINSEFAAQPDRTGLGA